MKVESEEARREEYWLHLWNHIWLYRGRGTLLFTGEAVEIETQRIQSGIVADRARNRARQTVVVQREVGKARQTPEGGRDSSLYTVREHWDTRQLREPEAVGDVPVETDAVDANLGHATAAAGDAVPGSRGGYGRVSE